MTGTTRRGEAPVCGAKLHLILPGENEPSVFEECDMTTLVDLHAVDLMATIKLSRSSDPRPEAPDLLTLGPPAPALPVFTVIP